MSFLFTLGLIALIVYFYSKSSNGNIGQLHQRDKDWAKFIASHRPSVNNSSASKLIDKMLDNIVANSLLSTQEMSEIKQQSGISNDPDSLVAEDEEMTKNKQINSNNQAVSPNPEVGYNKKETIGSEVNRQPRLVDVKQQKAVNVKQTSKAVQIDNISLLLYFGAFLFVASVGLFVAFGGASGWIRTLAVLFVSLSLYGVGQWLYKEKPALALAGLAFAGISIAITPLVGVAAYGYIKSISPQFIWFATSLLCLGMYTHALLTLKKPLINYIFIFTILSTFESGVAIMQVPAYYFGWAIIALGLILQGVSVWKGIWPDFRDASKAGSHLYVPLAGLVSLAVVQSQGFGQLGVTLLLGTLFYGLESWRSRDDSEYRSLTSVVSHLSFLLGVSSILYGLTHSIAHIGWLLVGLSVVQLLVLVAVPNSHQVIINFASVMLGSTVVGMLLLLPNKPIVVGVLVLIIAQSLFVWLKQKREDAYLLAMLGWLILPNMFGLYLLSPRLPINSLIGLNVASLILQIVLFILVVLPRKDLVLTSTGRKLIVLQSIIVSIVILFASPYFAILAYLFVSLVLLSLSFIDESSNNLWEVVSGIVISLAVIKSWADPTLALAVIIALAYNVLLALRFRSEFNRWLSTGLWLLWPIAAGGLTSSNIWPGEAYAWAYVLVMIGLVISRAIARGAVFSSSNVMLASYARTASYSYSLGYIIAGFLAFIISLGANNSQLHTSLILVVITAVICFLARIVEKNFNLLAFIPILLQILLISVIRPPTDYIAIDNTAGSNILASTNVVLIFTILLSSLLAVLCYFAVDYLLDTNIKHNSLALIKQSSILASAFSFGWVLFADSPNIAMPIGLAVTGMLLFDYWRGSSQLRKEISISVLVFAFMWLINILGVKELQAHTHIVALTLAGFAWWRNNNGDKANCDLYIYGALSVSTIPLIIQTISTSTSNIYAWWLLIDQVMFMIIGSKIRKRFVVLWGLYVGVGSVLYQLRNLGYAALAVLAIFVIGMAIYQMQKSSKQIDDN